MTDSESIRVAAAELRRLAEELAGDPEIRGIIQARDEVVARYGDLFSIDRIATLTEDEFRSFLYFDNNRHWGSLYRQAGRLTSDMEGLRRAMRVLVDEDRDVRDRLDALRPRHGDPAVAGLGRALMTAILLVTQPDRYGVWNSTSEKAMREMGVWPDLPRGASFGEKYEAMNDVQLLLSSEAGVDLWTLDALWWATLRRSSTSAFLLTWNPERWDWGSLADDCEQVRLGTSLERRWSCGHTKTIAVGDRLFLIKVGQEPRGIIGSGHATTAVFEDAHWGDPQKTAKYTKLQFDALLDPERFDPLPRAVLDRPPLDGVHWSSQSSGIGIPSDVLQALEDVWADHLEAVGYGRDAPLEPGAVLRRALPDAAVRPLALAAFADAVEFAHQAAPSGWAIGLGPSRVWLAARGRVACSLERGGLWMRLPVEHLGAMDRSVLEHSADWSWDGSRGADDGDGEAEEHAYVGGHFIPRDPESHAWPVVFRLNCAAIERLSRGPAGEVSGRELESTRTIVEYLRHRLGRDLPSPRPS